MVKLTKGTVVSLKMAKTAVVEVETIKTHPLYKKIMKRSSSYKAHYEGDDLKVGDQVTIREVRPISKTVHWIIVK